MLFKVYNNYKIKYLLTIAAILSGYLFLIIFDNFSNHTHYNLCLFKLITKIPCPGCGMGRATLALLRGDVSLSLAFNILCIPFSVAITVSLTWLVIDLFRNRNTFFKYLEREMDLKFKILLYLIITINWIINIYRL